MTVYGTADIQVVPDRVDISAGVEQKGKDLAPTIELTTRAVTKAIELIRQAGVDAKEIQTRAIDITPVYGDARSGRTLEYYHVTKTIAFTLKDPAKFDRLLVALAQNGINEVENIRYRLADTRPHKDRARDIAILAAKEKAAALAARLGQKIGKAHTIEEESDATPVANFSRGAAANSIGPAFSSGDDSSGGSTMRGQITIRARLRVTFDLE